MELTVTRSSGIMVQPSEPTASGAHNLSVIDRLPTLQHETHTLHVFRHGKEAAKVIREALSKALVLYYPIAGRLVEWDGERKVDCTGEGVWFIEATANCSLESVNYFDDMTLVPKDELRPSPPPESYGFDPIMKIQLTQFSCGGFVVAISNHHSVTDGLGAAQFVNAIGEFARGYLHPKITPVWNRDAIPTPPRLARANGGPKKPLPRPPLPNYKLEHAVIDISVDQINKLKNEFLELTGDYCSTFDVVVASLWRIRTRIIDVKEDTKMNLLSASNTRKVMDPPLSEGYYGNCYFPLTVTATSGWLVNASNAEVVQLIKDAKAIVPTEFTKWLKAEEMKDSENPFIPPIDYTSLAISQWNRLGFHEVDYGWGKPVHVLPLQDFQICPFGIVGLPPTPEKGIRLLTWCVHSAHLASLVDQMRILF